MLKETDPAPCSPTGKSHECTRYCFLGDRTVRLCEWRPVIVHLSVIDAMPCKPFRGRLGVHAVQQRPTALSGTCGHVTPNLPLVILRGKSGKQGLGVHDTGQDNCMIRRPVFKPLCVRLCTEMRKSLGWFQLICLGIGAIIGAGIFVITGARLLKLLLMGPTQKNACSESPACSVANQRLPGDHLLHGLQACPSR